MPQSPPPGLKPGSYATQKGSVANTAGPGFTEKYDAAYEKQRNDAFNATPKMTSTSTTTSTTTTSTTTSTTSTTTT